MEAIIILKIILWLLVYSSHLRISAFYYALADFSFFLADYKLYFMESMSILNKIV